VFLFSGNAEKFKDQKKNKKVIYAKGKLDHIAGYVFKPGVVPLPNEKHGGKNGGQGNPNSAPG
jgi:hypothetical protein